MLLTKEQLSDARFVNLIAILLFNKLLIQEKYSLEQQTSNKLF